MQKREIKVSVSMVVGFFGGVVFSPSFICVKTGACGELCTELIKNAFV